MPVRPFTVADASVTVRVAFFTTSDAPSVESTVRLSIEAIGSAAARTISGSAARTVEMIAASLNCRYASARSARAFASASPLVNVMPASALPSSVVCFAIASALTSVTRACASPFVTWTAASAWPASLTRSASACAAAIRDCLSPSARRICASASASAGRTVRRDQLLLRAVRLELGELGLAADDLLLRLGLGERPGLGGLRLGGRGQRLDLGRAQRRRRAGR